MESVRDNNFEAFDRNHPEVYESFEAFCTWLYKHGVRRFSAQEAFACIRNQVRLEMEMLVSGDPAPKPTMINIGINRGHFPRYARKLAGSNPKFAEFFELVSS
jgi:hypothetical protein